MATDQRLQSRSLFFYIYQMLFIIIARHRQNEILLLHTRNLIISISNKYLFNLCHSIFSAVTNIVPPPVFCVQTELEA